MNFHHSRKTCLRRFFVSVIFAGAAAAPASDETLIYADNFRWGTAAQGYWFSHNTSAGGTPWERIDGSLRNSNGNAANSTAFKSFNAVTLSQPGDYIRLRWEYRSLVNNDRQGAMEVGLFNLGAPFLANSLGTPRPIAGRPGLVLFQNHFQDFSYVRYYPGSGTSSNFLINPQTGSNPSFTGRIDGGVYRPCELVIEKRADGIWVSGILNGVTVPGRVVPGQGVMTFNTVLMSGNYGGSDTQRYSSIRNVKLSVPEHLLPTPVWDSYNWSQVTEKIPGVRHAKFTINSPRLMALNAVRIDLSNPDLRLYSTPRASGYVAGSRETLLRRTTGFMSDARANGKPLVFAINGDFFTPVSSQGIPADLLNVAYSDGVQVSAPRANASSPAFVFFKDWTADVVEVTTETDMTNFLQAVGTYQYVIDGHVPTGATSPLEPRTVIGVCVNRRYVFFLTVDGRRSGHSDGASTFELGELMRYFGAHAAINLDGGGSTTLVQWNASTNSPEILNVPSDQNTFLGIPVGGSVERPVGNHLGVYAITTPETIAMDDWLAARGVPAGQRGRLDDPNDDGISNLEAYAFNIHPIDPQFPFGPDAMPVWALDGNEIRYTFRVNRHAVGINYILEHSTTLKSWNILPTSAYEMLTPVDSYTGDTYFRTSIIPGDGAEFLRLRITSP